MELVLAIPVLGALIIIGNSYVPLVIMFFLHLITLVLSMKSNESKYGSVLGIITSIVAWIPFVGWILHLLSGIMLLVSASRRH
ncbi:hypothetical protein [Paenibacillus silvisoli]|uniref:hypothetical protein n=1 Tax=Paenibacillus silvisoli TaxID=3110539 RepID=UPI0038991553